MACSVGACGPACRRGTLQPAAAGEGRAGAEPPEARAQVAYLIIYGALPSGKELARWDEALMRHSAVPVAVERAVAALPHDAHFMGIVLTALNALSTVHPEQNPALAGQSVYNSREIQDKQIVRIIGAPQRLP